MTEIKSRVLYNGNYSSTDKCKMEMINRAFLYGDSLFETILADNAKLFFWETHKERLQKGFNALKYKTGCVDFEYFSEKLKKELEGLLRSNKMYQKCKVRLSVFRENGGNYTPEKSTTNYLATLTPLSGDIFSLNEKGLYLSIYQDIKKDFNILSGLKTGNSLLYILAGMHSRSEDTDDCLLINKQGNIVEASSSNIFCVKGDTIYTPPLTEGCVAGTMRSHLIDLIKTRTTYKLQEESINEKDLFTSEEVFLSNALSGIQWVVGYKNKRYFKRISGVLSKLLQESIRK